MAKTPDTIRQQKSRGGLKEAGGSRLDTPLSPLATAHLLHVMRAMGFKTKKEAIEWALQIARNEL
jgi:hypothetical protein